MHIRDEHMLKETKVRMNECSSSALKLHVHLQVHSLSFSEGPLITESVIDPQLLDASINNTSGHTAQSNDRFRDMAAQHALSAEEDEQTTSLLRGKHHRVGETSGAI